MTTTATVRLVPAALPISRPETEGRDRAGKPGSTAASILTPIPCSPNASSRPTPAAIMATAMGNFGTSLWDRRRITRAPAPSITDRMLTCSKASQICKRSSRSSPEPEPLPRIFGICIRIMVKEIPVINPPITGVEM